MLDEIQKLKDELAEEFFNEKPKKNKTSTKKDNGDNLKAVEIIQKLKTEVRDDGVTTDIVNTIFMHRYQPKRFEQLKEINRSRSMYQDTYYEEQFEILDNYIEDIEEEIFRCTKISTMAFKYGVKGIVMAAWCKGTIHIDRIRLAYELSAEYRMDLASDVLEKGIKDPNLQIQYTGLIRELALHHSRMAGFQNQKKFGKRPDIEIGIRPVQQITDQQMDRLIETFREDRKKVREIGEGFTSYTEIPEDQTNAVVQPVGNSDSIVGNSEVDNCNSIEDVINKAKERKAAEDNGIFDLDKI